MTDGAYCKHNRNVFDPNGCPECTREHNLKKPVERANGSHSTGPGEALAEQVKKFNVESDNDK